MNVTCPRCRTIILASHEARRFNCPTCQTRYCRHCQHWSEQGQKYCLQCGQHFSVPPDAIHASITRSAGLALLFTMLLALFYSSQWYGLIWLLGLFGLYLAVYLVRFQRRTRLTWAVRREALALVRQGIIWGSIAYFLAQRMQTEALGVLIVGTLLATGLGLFIINRLNPPVLDELRAHRATWKAVLGLKAVEAFLMRFPAAGE